MKKIVYKFVGVEADGRLASAYADFKASKTYVPGVNHRALKWLADKGYHSLAFKNRKAALAFRGPSPYVPLWKCEAMGVMTWRKLPPICQPGPLDAGELEPISSSNMVGAWPKGTVMCKTIKLLERVG